MSFMPVHLFVGAGPSIERALLAWAVEVLNVPQESTAAVLVRERTHPSLRFLAPGKNGYKRADFEGLVHEISRARESRDPLLCVIENASALNDACANSLLKVLEEPPRDVFFAFTAPSCEQVLPTVRSRALVVVCEYENDVRSEEQQLYQLLVACKPISAAAWIAALEQAQLDDVRTRVLLDAVFQQLHTDFQRATCAGEEARARQIDRVLKVLVYALDRLPVPGNVPLFWRNFYLMISI